RAASLVGLEILAHLEGLTEIVPLLGGLVETGERDERLVVGAEPREDLVVRDDRVVGVLELPLVGLADAATDVALLVLALGHRLVALQNADELLPSARLLVKPLERTE